MSAHQRISAFKIRIEDRLNSIRTSGNASWNGINLAQREERIILDYLTGRNGAGLAYLNQHLAPSLAGDGFEVKFAGVFCHGHPQVQAFDGGFQAPLSNPIGGACELGDLHLVFALLDQSKKLRDQRSILIQAKMAPAHSGKSLIEHENQRTLYESAGSFEYTTVLQGRRFWPRYRDRERALHYLFCGKQPVTTSAACAPAEVQFGEMLFRFLDDAEGLYFRQPTRGWPGWWNINWDLLTKIANRTYRDIPRGNSVVDLLLNFNDFTDPRDFFLESGDGGMSTLFVIVKDNEMKPASEEPSSRP